MLTTLQPTVTPSSVPQRPFTAMVAEKRSALDSIADIAGKAADIANIISAPAGSRVVATQTPGPTVFGLNSIFTNPLFLVGATALVVILLKK